MRFDNPTFKRNGGVMQKKSKVSYGTLYMYIYIVHD